MIAVPKRLQGALLTAIAVVLVAAPGAARAATVTLEPTPVGARTFATSAGGWTSSVTYGGVCVLPGVTCPNAAGSYVGSGGSGGAGDGHLRADYGTVLGVLSNVTVAWTSPAFTAPAETDEASLHLTLRPQVASLLSIGGAVSFDAVLVDVAAPGQSTTIAAGVALTNSASFSALDLALPDGAVASGRSYRLELRSRLSSGVAAAIATGSVDFDDVELRLSDLLPPSGLSAMASSSGTVHVAGSVDPQAQATSVVVEYGASASYTASTAPVVVSAAGAQAFDIPLAGLTPGATYHYRVVAQNADGTTATSDATFTVPQTPGDGGGTPGDGGTPGGAGSPGGDGTTGGNGDGGSSGSGDGSGHAGIEGSSLAALLSRCYGGPIALTDVDRQGRRVRFSGLSASAPGTAVAIVDRRSRRVASAIVNARGRFSARAALPAKSGRGKARYRAVVGTTRSRSLALQRRNVLQVVRAGGARVVVKGRVDKRALRGSRKLGLAVFAGRGPAACAATRKPLHLIGRVRFNARTLRYSARLQTPTGSGPLVVRTRVTRPFKGYSQFLVR